MAQPLLAGLRFVNPQHKEIKVNLLNPVTVPAEFLPLWEYEISEVAKLLPIALACSFAACASPPAANMTAVSTLAVVLLPLAFVIARRSALAAQSARQSLAKPVPVARASVWMRLKALPGWLQSGLRAVLLRRP
jgi:hypothetical protein